jgi:hypothetical protein
MSDNNDQCLSFGFLRIICFEFNVKHERTNSLLGSMNGELVFVWIR